MQQTKRQFIFGKYAGMEEKIQIRRKMSMFLREGFFHNQKWVGVKGDGNLWA